MGRRSNFNDEPDAAHRFDNFERRLRTTTGSELEPESVTPNSAGAEELPEYEEIFPLTRQFNQTNMHSERTDMTESTGRGRGSDDQRQSKSKRRASRTEERKSGMLG